MPTLKTVQMGGLGLPGTLLDQEPTRPRDMLNMVQDPDGVYYTRNGDAQYERGSGNTLAVMQSGDFEVKKVVPFVGETGESPVLFCSAQSGVSFATNPDELFLWDLETNRRGIRQSSLAMGLTDSEIGFTEAEDTLYFLPLNAAGVGGLHKYDGLKFHRAGLPRCAVINSTVSSTTYSRSIYLTLDFAGNETQSDYTQRGNTPSAGNITLNPTLAGSATPSPVPFNSEFLDQGFDNIYLDPSATPPSYNAGTLEITVPVDATNILVGHWMQFYPGSGTNWNNNQTIAKLNGRNLASLIAMRCVSFSGGSPVFDASPDNSYVWVDQSEWITATEWDARGTPLSGGTWTPWATQCTTFNSAERLYRQGQIISNTWILHFTSTSATSGFILRYARPVGYNAPTYNDTVPTASFDTFIIENPFTSIPGENNPLAASILLEDIFDDTVAKLVFPLDCKYLTTSAGFLILASEKATYFSSTSFGSSIEMTDGFSNFVPGTNRDGLIVGIGATENFVFISREKRNYTVIGNLATGNFEVRAYRETQPGTTDWKNIISVQDNVFFSNRFGIFAANQATQVAVSDNITGMFYKATVQRLSQNGEPMGPLELGESSYDFTRNWISWRYTVNNLDYTLVLDLNRGEYYRWSWPETGTMQFVNGLFYSAIPDGEESLLVEDPDSVQVDGEDIESWVTIPWIHLGEPSLEKQFTQIKVFLRDPNTASNVLVDTFLDWNEETARQTDLVFDFDPLYPLSQKTKFISNKSLSISVCIKNVPGEKIEIEGFELEYNQMQEGMKR